MKHYSVNIMAIESSFHVLNKKNGPRLVIMTWIIIQVKTAGAINK